MSREVTDEQTTSTKTCVYNFDLNCIRPAIKDVSDKSTLSITKKCEPKKNNYRKNLKSDGFYINLKHSASNTVLGYSQDERTKLNILKKFKSYSKLIEITFHDVQLEKTQQVQIDNILKITTISILLEKKIICKTKYPFNRKVHKLLFHNKSLNYNDLSIQVNAQGGNYSTLPLYVPKVDEKNMKMEIQFGINDDLGNLFSGTITYSISSSNQEQHSEVEQTYIYPILNDPNDPSHNIFYFRPIQQIQKNVKYFLLEDFALKLTDIFKKEHIQEKSQSKSSNISVSESNMSLMGLRNFIQRKKTFEIQEVSRSYINKKPVLSITILRGVEVPVREESAAVEPFVEIQWGDTFRSTSPADGPAPVWHEVLSFPVLKICDQKYIDIRIFDKHPIWGMQWLGACKIPIECYGEYEEFERWVDLSPLQSPFITFGYVQVRKTNICLIYNLCAMCIIK